MFETDLLVTFLKIVDHQGFTPAAQAMNSTQSTVSAKLARLEKQAGCPLIVRNKRGFVALTRQGETIEQLARDTVRIQKMAIQSLSGETVSGVVRIGLTDDIASGKTYPSLLAEFCRRQPGILLEVTVGNGSSILECFESGNLDHVLIKADDRMSVEAVGLWSEPLVWLGRMGGGDPVRLITFTPPCLYRDKAVSMLRKREISWKVVYVSPSLAGVKAAVRAGLGITVLPISLISDDIPEISTIELPSLGFMRYSLLSKPEPHDAANALFRDLVINVVPAGRGKPSDGSEVDLTREQAADV